MKTKFWFLNELTVILLVSSTFSAIMAQPNDPQQQARQILDATNFKAGLIIHIGCGDGKLTAALRINDSYIVQGLDADIDKVEKAKKTIVSKGLYGKVTAREFDGKHLPYIDNLVNLVVTTDKCKVSEDEIVRILAPRGVAYIQG